MDIENEVLKIEMPRTVDEPTIFFYFPKSQVVDSNSVIASIVAQ